MKKNLSISLLALLIPVALYAQPVVVPRGQTFNVEWNSRYPNTAEYRFVTFIDTVQTRVWSSNDLTQTSAPLADCFGTTTPPTGATCFLYRGTHSGLQNTGTRNLQIRVTEVASGLNSAFSPTVQFVVGNVPDAPTNPRVVVVTTQAGVTFEFKSAPVTVAAQGANVTVKVPVASVK